MENLKCIYVQGCARSGNTLMRELCASSFQHAELVKVTEDHSEIALKDIVQPLRTARKQKSPTIYVASRNGETSRNMSREMLRECVGLKVIWMLRNPLDVLTSIHAIRPGEFYVKPKDLIQCLKLYQQFKDEEQVFTVHYEELVSKPDEFQNRIAKAFNLQIIRKFTESYKFFPRFKENVRALHSIRPIDLDSVDKWKQKPELRQYLENVIAEFPEIVSLASECDYEINLGQPKASSVS